MNCRQEEHVYPATLSLGGWPGVSEQKRTCGCPVLVPALFCRDRAAGHLTWLHSPLFQGDQNPRPVAKDATRAGHPRERNVFGPPGRNNGNQILGEQQVSRTWDRSPDYSLAAMADFDKRLSKARPNDRVQHLRVKVVILSELCHPDADFAAIELLSRVINEHAEVWYEVNFAHEKLGSLLERMGRYADAEREYRWVVKSYEKSRSGTSGVCDLALAELIIRTG